MCLCTCVQVLLEAEMSDPLSYRWMWPAQHGCCLPNFTKPAILHCHQSPKFSISRNAPGLQHQIRTSEVARLLNGAATEFSDSPVHRQSIVGPPRPCVSQPNKFLLCIFVSSVALESPVQNRLASLKTPTNPTSFHAVTGNYPGKNEVTRVKLAIPSVMRTPACCFHLIRHPHLYNQHGFQCWQTRISSLPVFISLSVLSSWAWVIGDTNMFLSLKHYRVSFFIKK